MDEIKNSVAAGLMVFAHPEFGTIRSTIIGGVPWLIGKGGATALGYSNPSKAIINHVDEDDKRFEMLPVSNSPIGNLVKTALINESGLYSLIFSSKMPDAKRFKHWVTHEVLPSIRETGSYNSPGSRPLPTPEQSLRAVELLSKTGKADRDIAISILRQGGFDVEMADALPAGGTVDQDDAVCIREFLEDVLPRARWKMIPFQLAYNMYCGWLGINHPGVQLCSKKRFIRTLWPLVKDFGWTIPGMEEKGESRAIRPYYMMEGPEPLIVEYGCVDWYSPDYQGSDVSLIACPRLKSSYRGIRRIS